MNAAGPARFVDRVPNLLSALRIFLAAVFPFVPAVVRLPVVLVSAATDALDGWIARRFDATSALGGVLDAVADKLFTLSALLTLAASGLVAWWQVPVVLARDIAVALVCAYVASHREWKALLGMPARWPGKVTTLLVFAFLTALLVPFLAHVRAPLFVLTGLASLVAAADYLRCFVRAARRTSV